MIQFFNSSILNPFINGPIVNSNGISDLYEKKYNNGELFSSGMVLDIDTDGDGWSTAEEAIFGTNPFSRDGTDGFLQQAF